MAKPKTPPVAIIESEPGNPDETVNLGDDFVDDDGVEISKEVENQLNPDEGEKK